ncbi:hypothetical protein M408DRAFT_7765 [Serendipita vermifera MAFF 305830]|uniref:Uncharacterized protein n=1 Tax=Serendipita vermifera MAFF 305830 TaxID=933852 RepID=A0A0C2WVR9_SERVB|nr:hypothetical protein M408DRAFT_7765 [Serendipita vermifera MAFF 305830]
MAFSSIIVVLMGALSLIADLHSLKRETKKFLKKKRADEFKPTRLSLVAVGNVLQESSSPVRQQTSHGQSIGDDKAGRISWAIGGGRECVPNATYVTDGRLLAAEQNGLLNQQRNCLNLGHHLVVYFPTFWITNNAAEQSPLGSQAPHTLAGQYLSSQGFTTANLGLTHPTSKLDFYGYKMRHERALTIVELAMIGSTSTRRTANSYEHVLTKQPLTRPIIEGERGCSRAERARLPMDHGSAVDGRQGNWPCAMTASLKRIPGRRHHVFPRS